MAPPMHKLSNPDDENIQYNNHWLMWSFIILWFIHLITHAMVYSPSSDTAFGGICFTAFGTLPTAAYICWGIAQLKKKLVHSMLLGAVFLDLVVLAYLVLGPGGPNHNFRVYWTWFVWPAVVELTVCGLWLLLPARAKKRNNQDEVEMGSYEGLRGDEEEQASTEKGPRTKKGRPSAKKTKSSMVETLGVKQARGA